MACALTQNITVDCRQSVGGIRSIFVTELANKDTLTVSGGTVSTFTLDSGKKFFRYDMRKQTGSFTETITVSDENGSIYYAPEVIIQFSKLEVNKRNEIQLLAQNDVMVIVLDNNGSYWLVGSENGLSVSAGTSAAGTAFGDLNGYNITLTGGEKESMYSVPANMIAALTTT